MRKERLNDLADAYADRVDDGIHTARQCAVLAFKAGFDTRRKEIWRAPDEMPGIYSKAIVLVTGCLHFRHTTFRGDADWRQLCKETNALKWAYKSDLL